MTTAMEEVQQQYIELAQILDQPLSAQHSFFARLKENCALRVETLL